MKIVAISDTHNEHEKIKNLPEADMIIHCGDMTNSGKPSEIYKFHMWWKKLPYKYKIAIPGNHDRGFAEDKGLVELMNTCGNFLLDSSVVIEGIKFHGTPWVLRYGPFAFMDDDGPGIKGKFDLIPSDTDVLISHGPPHLIRDRVTSGEHVGSVHLLNRVIEVKPKYHVFGHIHEDFGREHKGHTTFINVASKRLISAGSEEPYAVFQI